MRLLSLTEAPGATAYSGIIASAVGGALNLGKRVRGNRHRWLAGDQPLLDGTGAIDWSTVPGLRAVALSGRHDHGRRHGGDHKGFGFFTGGATFALTRTDDHEAGTTSATPFRTSSSRSTSTTPLLIGTSDYGLSLTSGTVRLLSLTGAPGATAYTGVIASGVERRAEPRPGLRRDGHRRFAGAQPLLDRYRRDRLVDGPRPERGDARR